MLIAGQLLLFLIVSITLWAIATSRFGWAFYLELFSHFQIQYWVMVIGLLIGAVLLRQKTAMGAGLLCGTLLGAQLFTWYLPSAASLVPFKVSSSSSRALPKDARILRVLISNIHYSNAAPPALLSFVQKQDPDVAILMEVTSPAKGRLNALVANFPHRADPAPHAATVIYSKHPLKSSALADFGHQPPGGITLTRIVLPEQRSVQLVAAHLSSGTSLQRFFNRNHQLADMSQYVQQQDAEQPILLAGDFNLTAWSPYYRQLIHQTGLSSARKGFGVLPTWPNERSLFGLPKALSKFFAIPIDQCLFSVQLQATSARTAKVVGSDHKALIVDLVIPF